MPDRCLERAVFVRDPAAVTRRLGEETVIVPLRHDVADLTSIYTLNDTGSFVWELLGGAFSLQQVCDRLEENFDVDPGQARRDVLELITDLEAEGLIREQRD